MSNRKSMPEKNLKGGKKQKFRGKKNSYSGNGIGGRCDVPDKSGYCQGDNDLSWYSKYPQLLVAGASFPYPYRPGMDVKLGQVEGGTGTDNVMDWRYHIP